MDELLKSIRSIHTALCIVMGAIILISVTSYRAHKYDGALDDLRDLKQLPWGEYGDFCLALLTNEYKEKYDGVVSNEYETAIRDMLKLKVNVDSRHKISNLIPFVSILPASAKISEYRGFLAKSEIGYYRPGPASEAISIISTDFDHLRSPIEDKSSAEPGSNESAMNSRLTRDSTIHGLSLDLFLKSHDIIMLKLPSETEVVTKPLLPKQRDAILKLYFTTPPSNAVGERIVITNVIPLFTTGDFGRRWLVTRKSLLLGISDGDLLPRTVPFRDEIDGRTIDDAISYISQQKKEQEQNFSFLGQSFAGGIVGLIGPSMLLVGLFLMVAYQRQLIKWKLKEKVEIDPFPWIGVSSDSMSRFVFILSVACAPIGTIVVCLKYLVPRYSWIFLYTLAVLVISIVLGVIVILENTELLDHENKHTILGFLKILKRRHKPDLTP